MILGKKFIFKSVSKITVCLFSISNNRKKENSSLLGIILETNRLLAV